MTDPRKHLQTFERFIRRDPAERGLISSERRFGPLCPGHLAQAAGHLASHGRRVGIVTGFFIPTAEAPACETDGPAGSVTLAAVLERLGIESFAITDRHSAGAVQAAADSIGLAADRVVVLAETPEAWLQEAAPTHLVAIERIGPSHTEQSIRRQYPQDPSRVDEFLAAVAPEHRGCCHNMRGLAIDAFTAPLHRLFEAARAPGRSAPVSTIGVGDGANEIGMGSIPWHELRRRLAGEQAARVPCRVPADWTIFAGVSNWGGFALAAGVALLKGRVEVLRPFDCAQQERLLGDVVERGPSVDGVTGRREATVDGLPFVTYIQPWAGIRRELGLAE